MDVFAGIKIERLLLLMMIIIAELVVIMTAYSIDYDYDTNLDFMWTAATGTVHHYNVYASTDNNKYILVGTTATNSYTLLGEGGHKYKIKVQAVDAVGNVGEMSEESDPVICLWNIRLLRWRITRLGILLGL